MIDYIASKAAYREHEERVQSFSRVDDYDVWLKDKGRRRQTQPLANLRSSLSKILTSVADKVRSRQEAATESQLTGQEPGSVTVRSAS